MMNRCFTCGYVVGHYMYDFIIKRLEILKNNKLTDEEKNMGIKNLIDSYNLPRYCCKAQLLSFKDIVNED